MGAAVFAQVHCVSGPGSRATYRDDLKDERWERAFLDEPAGEGGGRRGGFREGQRRVSCEHPVIRLIAIKQTYVPCLLLFAQLSDEKGTSGPQGNAKSGL